MDRFAEYALTLLAQFGGGRGGPENEFVRFSMGAVLWAALLVFAVRRRRVRSSPGGSVLAWGCALGLLHDVLLFVAFSLRLIEPRLELARAPVLALVARALDMGAVCAVSAGFLRETLGARGGGRPLAAAGAGAAVALLFAGAFVRFGGSAGTGSETAWPGWAFPLATLAVLGWSTLLGARLRGWMRTLLVLAIGCFVLRESLGLADLATGGVHGELLGPFGSLLRLGGLALLVAFNLRQLAGERDDALKDLQTLLNLTEHERRRSEEILDAIGDAVSVQDRDFRILHQNRVHRELFGTHLGEVCHRAYAATEAPCPGCPVALAFADGTVHRIERPRVVDGERVGTLEVTASCLHDAAGRVVAGIEVARDVTERVAAAEELHLAKEELERQNAELRSLDAVKDGLIRDVTHEFKTPVAKHAMQLEILRGIVRDHGLEHETGKVLAVMGSSIARQQRMIRNILDLARLEAGGRRYQIVALRLDEVVAEVLEDMAYAIESYGVSVSWEAPPLVVGSDREMVRCLLSNLIDNAIKYRATALTPVITVEVTAENGQAVLRVADNGIGFAPGQVERAFDRFWQASASAEGSGVGLSICRMIAEDLGGSITIFSAGLGQGTTVTVRLPVASPDSPLRWPERADHGATAPGTRHRYSPRPGHGAERERRRVTPPSS